MKTRMTSLNNFCNSVDELINTKYLLAGSKISEVVNSINSSKLLSDIFKYFTDEYDFYKSFANSLCEKDGVKTFILPEQNTTLIAFVYKLLCEINYKKIQLTDILDYFGDVKNYELAYSNFCSALLVPFKSYTYQICIQTINNTQEYDNNLPKQDIEEVPFNVEESTTKEPVNVSASIVRLIELDKLSVSQSRISKAEKEELFYIIDLFLSKIKEGEAEKIKLAYLSYYYAIKPYRKIKNNIKEITNTLIDKNIL